MGRADAESLAVRILITGSEGTIGKPLQKELRRCGHDVFCCDLMHTSEPFYMRADISERRELSFVFSNARPGLVFHLAAEFGRQNGESYFERMWRTNVIGTQNVIRECIAHDSRLVFASSSEAYGRADLYARQEEDFKEEWLDRFAPEFHNQYALSKWTNERQIFMAARNEELKAIVLRLFNIYGPGEFYTPYRSVVCLLLYRLLKGLPVTVYENSFRSHLYVQDWAEWVAQIAQGEILSVITRKASPWPGSGSSGVPVFNLGGVEYESTMALKNRIVEIIGGSSSAVVTVLREEYANIASKMPDISLARNWLQYAPKTTLQEGLARTAAWMRKTYGLAKP
jgi:dTDP-glucose 4,6-dehydratase